MLSNGLNRLAAESKDLCTFAAAYVRRLREVLDGIDPTAVARFGAELEAARAEGATVFVAGNGGSATTASSMANDLGFDVVKKSGTERPLRVLALTDNNAVLTAIANDVGYENVFVNQLRIHYRPGDRLVVISASGNSVNVVRAAEFVKGQGGRVVGLLGFSGGKLREMCDVVVHVPTELGEYGPVEDAHLTVNHILAHWFQCVLRGA